MLADANTGKAVKMDDETERLLEELKNGTANSKRSDSDFNPLS